MTRNEVSAILGEPNEKQMHAGKELWGYYIQEFGWSAWINPVYVSFGADGEVTHVWSH